MADGVTILDIAAVLIVIVSVATAALKGFAAELISLASVVAGLILAFAFYDRLAAVLLDLGSGETLALLGGFLLIFAAVVALGILMTRLVRKTLRLFYLRFADRLLGGVFGVLRGWLVMAIIFLAMTAFPVTGNLVANSISGEFFLTSAGIVIRFAPEELQERFSKEYQRIYQLWLEKTRQEHHTRDKG